MDGPDRLAELAEAVADGRPVEWEAETAADPGSIDSFTQLQILAGIADWHRRAQGDGSAESTAPADLAPADPELFVWGPLSVRERIGSGSFGDVYRAWDPTLQREVALKLFRPRAGAAPEDDAVAREGQLLARVRHPNVMAVYGAQLHQGRIGMWSELLRGRTLHEIVKADGPMSAAEAAVYSETVCRALAAVHRAGLLHRDIKAQNVMRESGGRVVLMDLGLGREVDRELAAGVDLAGTPLYLAPELFAGEAATVQSDIYSVGVLMFFLVTGQFPVTGGAMHDLAEAHRAGRRRRLRDLRPDLPDAFAETVERALQPDRKARFESAGALQEALARAGGYALPAPAALPRARGRTIAWTAAALGVLGLGIAIGISSRRTAPAPPGDPIQFSMPTPDGLVLTEGDRNVPAISPDGRQVAFVGTDRVHGGVSRLYLWSLSRSEPQAIAGSENAANPFWSPDSQSVAFVTARGSALYRVSVSGARSERLTDLWESRGGSWSADGSLLIARQTSAIYRLDARGGNPQPITKLQPGEIAHMWPQALPDGQHFIFLVQGRDDRAQGIYLGSLDGSAPKKLVYSDSSAVYANGYLLFTSSGALFAQQLDVPAGTLAGPTVQLLPAVDVTTTMRTIVSASANGTLVFAQGKDARRLTWYDFNGNVKSTGDTASYRNPALSPDRPLLAIEWYGDWHRSAGVDAGPPISRGRELRVLRLPDYASVARIGGAGASDPVWGPNGQIAFVDVQAGRHLDVYVANVPANTEPRLLVSSDADKETTDWSRDGRRIAYHELHQAPSGKVYRELFIKPLDGAPYRAVAPPEGVSAHSGRFSPDSRWIAYLSDESGGVDPEIYARNLASGVIRQVSRHGGYNPAWRSNDTLVYLDPGGRLYEARLPASAAEAMPEPTLLFTTDVSTPRTSLRYFDLSSDGRQIVVASPLPSAFSVVVNWPAELSQAR
jgi:serine/threonine protein kinase